MSEEKIKSNDERKWFVNLSPFAFLKRDAEVVESLKDLKKEDTATELQDVSAMYFFVEIEKTYISLSNILKDNETPKGVAFHDLKIFTDSANVLAYCQTKYQKDLCGLMNSETCTELDSKYQEWKGSLHELREKLKLAADEHRKTLIDCLSAEREQLKSQERIFEAISAFLGKATDLYSKMLRSEMEFGEDYTQLKRKFIEVIHEELFEFCRIYYTSPEQSSVAANFNLTDLINLEDCLAARIPDKTLVFELLEEELIALEEQFWKPLKQQLKKRQSQINFVDAVEIADNFFTSNNHFCHYIYYQKKLKDYLLHLAQSDSKAADNLAKYFHEPNKWKRFWISIGYNWGRSDDGKDIRVEFFNELLTALNPYPDDVKAFCDFGNQLYVSIKDADKEEAQRILQKEFADLKKWYKELALKYHPDRNKDIEPERAKLIFQTINETQEQIKNYLEKVISEYSSSCINGTLEEMTRFYQESNKELLGFIERFEQLGKRLEENKRKLVIVQEEFKKYEKKQGEFERYVERHVEELGGDRIEMALKLKQLEEGVNFLMEEGKNRGLLNFWGVFHERDIASHAFRFFDTRSLKSAGCVSRACHKLQVEIERKRIEH